MATPIDPRLNSIRLNVASLALVCLTLAAPLLTIAAEGPAVGVAETKRIWRCDTDSLEDFTILAERAAKHGATHVFVSDLPKSRWQWDRDPTDPYPNWGMIHSSIFKLVVPQELDRWLPKDYALNNLEIVRKRCDILKRFGLKAAFSACEPGWLPEEVYEAHPNWRGPRCEHTRRARRAYYSPNIDDPEVLQMYRRAVAELCRQAPIEFFSVLTNDSGGGISWSQGLYPGPNGPEACKDRSFGDRVVGFLSAIQAGAADAGLRGVEIRLGGSIPDFEADAAAPRLLAGQYVKGRARDGRSAPQSVGFFDDFYFSNLYPVLGLPQPVKFAEHLSQLKPTAGGSVVYSFPDVRAVPLFDLMDHAPALQSAPLVTRWQVLRAVAASEVGESCADDLVAIWEDIDRCAAELAHMNEGGPILLLGGVNQRWLTRPFVPFPLELKPEERDYYRRFQFQAKGEVEAADLMNLQDNWLVKGFAARYLADQMFDKALASVTDARSRCASLLPKVPDDRTRRSAELLGRRLAALTCLIRNAENACDYQEILDRTDTSVKPQENALWHVPADPRGLAIRAIERREIDNTWELIGLLEHADSALLRQAPDKRGEDIFLLGPDLVEQLRRKVSIMLAHDNDYDRLFTRFN